MAKAYFSRRHRGYVLPMDTHSDEIFDAVIVDVPEEIIEFSILLREVEEDMQRYFDSNPTYEESGQAEADAWTLLIREEFGYGTE